MSAEEALQSLARDLIEEISAARAAELAGELPEALELAVYNVHGFQRTQRVGRSGKVVHEEVRPYTEQRAGSGLPHPDVGEHFTRGEPGHMIHNLSEPVWLAGEREFLARGQAAWKRHEPRLASKPKDTQKVSEEIRQTRQRLPGSAVHRETGQHLDAAQAHISSDQPNLAHAYRELAQAHSHIVHNVLPGAKPEEYPQAAEHLQRIAGHMQDLDRAMGAKPEATRKLLGSFRENFAHAGEDRRMAEQQTQLQDAEQEALQAAQAAVPEPKTGAAAVHPQLGTRHVQPLAGDTLSGMAHQHVPRPFEVPPPDQGQTRALKASQAVQGAQQELQYQRGVQASVREENRNAAVLERMGLPAPGTYRPLSDEEFTVHQRQVDDAVEKAFDDGLATSDSHTANGDGRTWEPDRASLHADILRDYLDKQVNVPSQRHALVLGGLPGAGKSTMIKAKGENLKDYALVSADNFKAELAKRGMVPEVAGLSPMESSTLVHEESKHLVNLAMAELERRGKNIAVEVTLSRMAPSANLVKDLKAHGYTVTGLLADIPARTSADRAGRRYRSEMEAYRRSTNPLGGRYIPRADLLEAEARPGETWPQRTFSRLKPQFDYWERWDGTKTPPALAEKAKQDVPVPGGGIPSVEELRQQRALDTEAAARAREKGTATP